MSRISLHKFGSQPSSVSHGATKLIADGLQLTAYSYEAYNNAVFFE
jgi:hypothetical protein